MKVSKKEFFNGTYEESFENFLKKVSGTISNIDFPSLDYYRSNPPIEPLWIYPSMLKTPDRIAEELVAIIKNFEKWKNASKSKIVVWFYSPDGQTLQNVILTTQGVSKTPRIYVSGGEKKFLSGSSWCWVFPFYYDLVSR